MANHKSAKKDQCNLKARKLLTHKYLTKFRTNLNKFHSSLKGENNSRGNSKII